MRGTAQLAQWQERATIDPLQSLSHWNPGQGQLRGRAMTVGLPVSVIRVAPQVAIILGSHILHEASEGLRGAGSSSKARPPSG